jgi:hypothetical protein
MNRNLKSKVMKSANHFRVIAPAILMLSFLTSCGGGGSSGGASTSTTPTATTEVINGITVPVAPDATANAATLKGVDSNNNGVRDDVERVIAEKSETEINFQKASALARIYQLLIVKPPVNKEEAIAIAKSEACIIEQTGTIDKALTGISEASIVNAIANSDDRKKSLNAYYSALGGVDSENTLCN